MFEIVCEYLVKERLFSEDNVILAETIPAARRISDRQTISVLLMQKQTNIQIGEKM